MKKIGVFILGLVFVFSCVRKADVAQPAELKSTGLTSLPYYPGPAPRQASEESIFDMTSIDLSVKFNWSEQRLIGDALLTIQPRFYEQDSVVLDARGFDINSVTSEGVELLYRYDSLKLTVLFNSTLTRKTPCTLRIQYVAKPNELPSGGGSAITEDKGLYFINPLGVEDKPMQIWTQGEPEANSCWVPIIDAPNQKIRQVMRITVADTFKTVSNGQLTEQLWNLDGTRTDVWEQKMPHSAYLMMMAVGDFAVVRDSSVGPIEVAYYVEPAFKQHAKAVFGNTPEMISFFSTRLGVDYPWDKYSQVVVRDFVSGAMENTSASIFMEQLQITSRETLDKNWDYIIAHELFHHWFGDYVTCESWSNLALNESFANYSEYLWLDYKYGIDMAESHRFDELQGYLGESRHKRVPIIRYNYHQPDDMFDAHSYNKGGLVLHMLRDYLGDEAFFESLRNYLETNAYKNTEVHHLRHSFEETTGKDLMWFFDKWFMAPGHPELGMDVTRVGDSLEIMIRQTQDSIYSPVFEFPLSIGLYGGKSSTIKTWVDSRVHTIKFECPDTNSVVVLNPNGIVPSESEFKLSIKDVNQLYNADLPFYTRLRFAKELTNYSEEIRIVSSISKEQRNESGTRFLDEFDNNQSEIRSVLLGLTTDSSIEIRCLAYQGLLTFQEDSVVEKVAVNAFLSDQSTKVRAEAIKYLSSIDTLGSKYRGLYVSGIKDSSYLVISSCLEPYLRIEPDKAGAFIETLESSTNVKIVNGLMTFYAKRKDSLKIQWAWSKYLELSPIGKIRVAKELAEMLNVLSSDSLIDFMTDLKAMGISKKHLYERFGAYKVVFYIESFDDVDAIRRDIIRNEKNPTLIDAYKRWEKKRE